MPCSTRAVVETIVGDAAPRSTGMVRTIGVRPQPRLDAAALLRCADAALAGPIVAKVRTNKEPRHAAPFRRDVRQRHRHSRSLPHLPELAPDPAARSDDRPAGRGRNDLPPRRHHLRGVRREGRGRLRHRTADPLRPDPAHHPQSRVARDGKGPGAARHRAEPLPPRRLSRPGDPEGRCRAARAGAEQLAVPARDARRGRARRRVLAHLRRGHRARRRRRRQRPLLRAGGQPACAQRRELHARRPQDDDAVVPEPVRRAPHRAGGALPRPAARDAARGGAGRRDRPGGGAADARHVQQRVLRARLPGAADGHRTGRGAGPVHARRATSSCAPRRARAAWT